MNEHRLKTYSSHHILSYHSTQNTPRAYVGKPTCLGIQNTGILRRFWHFFWWNMFWINTHSSTQQISLRNTTHTTNTIVKEFLLTTFLKTTLTGLINVHARLFLRVEISHMHALIKHIISTTKKLPKSICTLILFDIIFPCARLFRTIRLLGR